MDEETKLKQSAPKEWAAGMPAVTSSLSHILREAGPFRGTRGLMEMNQMGGFDCPSCAWPDPDGHRSVAEFCENGAKALASEATTKLADERFFAKHAIEDLLERSDLWHDRQGRIARPMIRREGAGHYEAISWDEAFLTVAEHLKALGSPDEAVFYTSGRASNEAAFLYQLFVRAFGTNNLPDCSNLCHESSGVAMKEAIGVGKGTVTLEDFDEAEVILCVGQNPGTNHPRMLSSLEAAALRGAAVVSVNPLREAGLAGFAHPQKPMGLLGKATPLASRFIQVRVNGDQALFRGVAKALLELENERPGTVLDEAFLGEHSANYEEYRNAVAVTGWDEIVRHAGVSEGEIRSLAELVCGGKRRLITCWAMGLTQHRNAVATIREIVNVHLLLGAVGRAGAGLCPVRGHSNVHGDRTVGISREMPEWFLAALERECGITAPRRPGYDTLDAIHAMHEGRARVLIGLGGNFLQASPDTGFTAAALAKCDLTCHVSTKLNRSHLVAGRTALILPCLGRSERDGDGRFVTTENSMGVVQMSCGVLAPASPHLLSEIEIVARLAEAVLGAEGPVLWRWLAEDYGRIRSLISQVVPGFDDYSMRASKPGGFHLPNSARVRVWNTRNGKGNFSVGEVGSFSASEGRLVLQTLRSHDQFNTTIYGPDDRYRGISNARRIILVCPEDLIDRKIRPGDKVDITSFWNGEERRIERFTALPYEMPKGCAAAYFPEANVLVPIDSRADGSGTPTSKAIEIEIRRSD